jgi:hypothetical protein
LYIMVTILGEDILVTPQSKDTTVKNLHEA